MIFHLLEGMSDMAKYPCTYHTTYRNDDALSDLLLSVISELLPSLTSFRLREIVLEEMRFRQKNIIKTTDVKCLNGSADDQKADQVIPKSKVIVFAVNPTPNK